MRFEREYPLTHVRPADYNPRHITDAAFERLCESIGTYGVVKPVIVNLDGTLVAGHQRTRAMTAVGMTTTPAIILPVKANRQDEINFNLLHNSIETNYSQARVINVDTVPFGYSTVQADQVLIVESSIERRGRGAVMAQITKLVQKYGPWGSVLLSSNGQVVLNADYAAVLKAIGEPVLVYRIDDANLTGLIDFMAEDYGQYSYDVLDVKPYSQTYCQMPRKGAAGVAADKGFDSTLYESIVIPLLDKTQRVVDFGAGKLGYVNTLSKAGYDIRGYEPYFRTVGRNAFNYKAILAQIRDVWAGIRKGGLYDVVILDSVLNSVTSLDFEQSVLATCAALMDKDGTFYTGTRNLNNAVKRMESTKQGDERRYLWFMDEDNFTATYRSGAWTMQRFHSTESLLAVLLEHFEEAELVGCSSRSSKSNIYARARKPRRQDPALVRSQLDTEFNMEYPDGFRHGKQGPIVDLIMDELAAAGRLLPAAPVAAVDA